MRYSDPLIRPVSKVGGDFRRREEARGFPRECQNVRARKRKGVRRGRGRVLISLRVIRLA